MSNRELYKRTFSQVHPSYTPKWEEQEELSTWRSGRPLAPRLATAAALCATAAVLCATAFTTNFLGLRDLFPQKQAEPPVQPVTSVVLPGSEDTMSLSGYMDSPEGQALAEWKEFLETYDPDHAILDQVGNYLDPAFDKYICYNVYTQDMADKLEEIVDKYGLKLHTQQIDLTAHPEALGPLADFVKDKKETYWSYMYEDGSCHFDGWAYVEDYGLVDVQFQRSVKGTFNDATLNIGDPAAYKQWTYQTSSGVEVVLALGSSKSLILADLPDCFATFNVFQGAGNGMTREHLEGVAERYDFSKLTPVVPPEDIPDPGPLQAPAGERTDARTVYAQVLRDLLNNGLLPDSGPYDAVRVDPAEDQFAVYDVDFDGEEELILLHNDDITAGMRGYVMKFDPTYTGTWAPISFQLADFPDFAFYDNGVVQVLCSHNQTHGELWPFELYGYDADGDYYYHIASVYSADKDLAREAEVGDVYSAEIDTSGTGRIYYVNFVYGSGVEPAGERAWDSEEYFAWLDSVLGRSQEVEIPYQHLTEQNIADTLGGQPPMQTVPPDGMPEG